eukprot:TRINITY_DN10144_c0_g1_i1.p1 TRINITY_DN10144_c0_g1~~TRINITY_DN10144_c0_g1_i1.p1  ORF type:complete len:383 (+),score=61.12 TRINITY_DN10144_c0_g1_i1:54-1202(+)
MRFRLSHASFTLVLVIFALHWTSTAARSTGCRKYLRASFPWLNRTDLAVLPRVREIDRAGFVRYYKCILQRIDEGALPERYVVYSPSETTSWEERVRGTASAFLLALVTERILVVNHDCHHQLFHPPPGIKFTVSQKALDKIITKKGASSLKDSEEIYKRVAKAKDLNSLFPEGVLKHGSVLNLDTAIAKNPKYDRIMFGLFGSKSRFSRAALIFQYLFQAPTSSYVFPTTEYMTLLGFRKKKTRSYVVAHFQPPYDKQDPEEAQQDFFECVNTMIEKWDYNGTLYFTSEEEKFKESALQIIKSPNVLFRNHKSTPALHFSSCVTPSTIDWFLMGESAGIISSPSTFSTLAAARTGFTFRFISATKQCLPIRSNSKDDDIEF